MHLEEKLETEDASEYGAEVYDEYKEEQARKEDDTNGSKKRGASIESEGEDDNTSKRHKSPWMVEEEECKMKLGMREEQEQETQEWMSKQIPLVVLHSNQY